MSSHPWRLIQVDNEVAAFVHRGFADETIRTERARTNAEYTTLIDTPRLFIRSFDYLTGFSGLQVFIHEDLIDE